MYSGIENNLSSNCEGEEIGMCPFCFAALAAISAQALAVGSGAALAAKFVLKSQSQVLSYGLTSEPQPEHGERLSAAVAGVR